MEAIALMAAEVFAPEVAATVGAEVAGEAAGSAMLPELLNIPPITSELTPELLNLPEITSTPFLESLPGIDTLPQSVVPPGMVPPEPSAPPPYQNPPLVDVPPGAPPEMGSPQEFVGPPQPAPGSGGLEDLIKKIDSYVKNNPYKSMFGAMSLGPMLNRRRRYNVPEYKGPQILNRYRWAGARGGPVRMADGGIAALPGYDMMVGEAPMYPRTMAGGGVSDLGTFSDGGRMLKGAGDGMSDSIPGVIAGKRPARLADSEFVVPADVVSHLGNGSTDAGAKQLYKMMDRVRMARTGTKKQGKQINPMKYLPA